MFDFTKEKMEEKKIENKAKDMFAELLIKSILESETAPEHVKVSVAIVSEVKNIQNILMGIVKKYTSPGNEANIETLKKVLDYLELVEVGINQFSENTPFVKHLEEE